LSGWFRATRRREAVFPDEFAEILTVHLCGARGGSDAVVPREEPKHKLALKEMLGALPGFAVGRSFRE
jgi:hypothetical protein